MGLLGKLKEVRMKDAVEGTLKVVGISMPDATSTQNNYRLDGVVSGPGLDATAIVHHGMTSVSHWPSPGDELPVTVDRADPKRIVIHWNQVPKGKDTAHAAAEQLAEQLRSGLAGAASGTPLQTSGLPSNVTITVTQDDGPDVNASDVSVPDGMAAVPTANSADILARGTAGFATLLGSFPEDIPSLKPDHTVIGLMLNVMIDGHPPFQIQNLYTVPNALIPSLTVGALLPVKADLATTGLVAVDWDHVT